MAYTPFLRGERVYLRAIEQTDVERAHRWINDREIQRWLGAFRPYDLKAEQAWFDGLDRKPLPNTLHFAICLVDGDRHIGTTSMQQIDWLNRSASTGTLIGEKECWGQGYGKEAKALLLEYAFDTLNLNRMWSSTMPSNARSIAHLKANGYVAEGRRRQALFKDGAYQDELLWAVLRDDWKASRA